MSSFQRISVTDAKALISSQAVSIVDIRDEESFKLGRITDALHLDNNSMQHFVQQADWDQPVIVCCYHGHLSLSAAAYLADKGFASAYSLDGGFTQWQHTYPEQCQQG